MAPPACTNTHPRICLRLSLCLFFSISFAVTAYAQTATYHLHREASSTANLFQLKTAGPDAASLAVQSANLKNQAVGEYLIKAFDTQSGVPNASGVIPAGSTVTFVVWMKKTANQGTMFPRVKLSLNSAGGTSVCVVTGPTALSTTLTKYTLTGTVSSNVSLTTTDRFYFWVGVNVTTIPNQNNQAELDVEGTLNGNYDSLITVPLPTALPSISGLTPNIGVVGTPITVTGTNFGSTQGTSTIKFNGITATTTSWSATSIAVPVPSGATTGTVVVTVNGQTSNGVAFTVTPSITSLTPNSGPVGTAVTVSGSAFGATQGTSTITFNGTPAIPSSWSAAAILTSVPAGATTGPVVTTVAGQPSNGVSFTVTETGAIGGIVTRTSNGAAINGALVEALQGGVVKASTTTAVNGSYAISNVSVGTYDGRVSASGYQTGTQNGVVVTANATTTVNQSLDTVPPVPPGDIDYIYDELGRLIAVVTTTETTIYTYDAVGNLLSIARGNSSQVSIIEFTPNSGGIGAEVRIFGTAFSTTPGQNAVTFNGVAANVTSASAREIVTTVPVGATTGPISVTTPSGTATSSTSFMVGTPGAPTVTSFTPTIGAAGTSVSITGTNFEPNLYNNKTEFNQTLSSITSATATNIATSVPLSASSGRISVRTPAGIGVSSGDFFIPPTPYAAADVEVTGRMSIGEDKTVTLTQANKIAIILFDGIAGQRVSLGMSGVTFGAPNCCDTASIVIYKPNGVLVAPFGFGPAGNGIATQVLPVTGTYTIVVDPYNAYTGHVTLSLFEDLVATISINGPPLTLNMTRVGQNARLTFAGTAGQRVSLGISAVTIGAPNYYDVGSVAIYKPDGTAMFTPPLGFGTAGNGTATQVLPVTGTYSITVDPYVGNTGNGTFTLSEDLANQITINGAPQTLTFKAGQNARLTFDGSAGQRVSVGISAVTIGAPNYYDVGSVTIYKPDGTAMFTPLGFGTAGNGTATQILPVTGTYSIVVDPYGGNAGNGTVTLSEDLANPVSSTDPPLTLNFRAGQNARLPFEGSAGQQVTVGISGVTIGAPNYYDVGSVVIYKPDGTTMFTPLGFGTAGNGTATQTLPVTGTYYILVDPYGANAGNGTVTLSEDLAIPITINGPALALTFKAGQNARLTFDGSAGQRVSVGISAVTIGAPNYYDVGSVAIYKPDGTAMFTPLGFGTAGNGTATQVLPVTGTYSIVVNPYGANAGNGTVTLSEDLANPVSSTDPPLTLTFRAGQNARLPFEGTAGQRVSVGIGPVTIGAPNYYDVGSVAIYKPDGTAMFTPALGFGTAGNGTGSQVLPVTGTYYIVIDPYYAYAGNGTVSLSEDLANPITINGLSLTLNFKAGQNARLPFEGTAGQRVSVGISTVTIGAPNYYDVGSVTIYKPDGTTMFTPLGFGTAGNGTASQVLPVTGTYYIVVNPYYAYAGNGTVTLSEDLANLVSPTDPPLTLNFRSGQNARLPFEGTAGQQVSVGLSGVTIGAPNYYDVGSVAIYKPDGTVLLSPFGFGTAGANTASQTLPTTGTYSLVVDPYLGHAGNLTLSLAEDLSSPISINGPPVTLQFTKVGQNARLSFSGNAGQWVSVGMSDTTISAVNCCTTSTVTIYKPDGTTLLAPFGFYQAGGGTPSVLLPTTGTYTILVDPFGSMVGNVTITLSEDLSPPININGPSVIMTNRVGQNARLFFSGNAGQWVSMGVSDTTVGAINCCTTSTVALYKPDGTTLQAPYQFYQAGAGTPSLQLPTTGTYSILVDPYNAVAGNFTLTLSEDLSPPTSINGPAVTLTNRAGQNERLFFSGNAGQWVSLGVSDTTIGAPSCCTTSTVAIYKPDGTALLVPTQFYSPIGTSSLQLPTTGTYAILVDPYLAVAGNVTLTLSEDLSTPITINGPAVTLTNRAGQNERLTFSGNAGQWISLAVSDVTIAATACCTNTTVAIYKPDGTTLLAPIAIPQAGITTQSFQLTANGTYTMLVDPYNAVAGNVTLTLSEDLSPPISINGPPVVLQFNRPGQNSRLFFSGNAGQWVSVGTSDSTISAVNCCTTSTVTIYKPDGTVLLSPFGFYQVGGGSPSVLLPTTGTYAMVVEPYNNLMGSVTLTLSEDLSPPISINGPAVTLTNRVGQNARLFFSGNAGQWVSLGVGSNNVAAVNCCTTSTVAMYKPDGTTLLAPYQFYQVGAGTPSVQLPTTGTYSFVVDPYIGVAGDVAITLSEDLSPPMSINGPAVTLTNRAGQNARLPFSGSAGQWISLGVSDTTIGAPNCCTTSTVAIYKPDGTALLAPLGFYQAGVATSSIQLPTTGTYVIVVDAYNAVAGNTTLTLSEDLATTITINGSPQPLSFRVGQNASLSFNGTSGQQATVRVTSNLLGSVTVKLLKPDGTQLTSAGSSSSAFNLAGQTLPTTGNFLIVIDPTNTNSGTLSIAVTSP